MSSATKFILCGLATLAACQGATAPEPAGEAREAILGSNALSSNALSSNALSSNALSSNALSSNALSSNALSSNALSSNALSSNALRPDGQTEGAVARQFLTYVYSCAMPLGASMHLVIDGQDLGTYNGAVGLAPEWGEEGGHCDGQCQRWVTACLLARTNFWGVPVKISLRGARAALASSGDERTRYPLREGTYFGNLFDRSGPSGAPSLFACAGPGSNLPQLTNRFCSGAQGPCNISVALDCLNPLGRKLVRPVDPNQTLPTRYACQRQDPNDGSMLDCWTGGVSIYGDDPQGEYFPQAITVNLQEPVAICGDGVCTGTETAATCASDCSTGWARSFPGVLNTTFGFGLRPDGDLFALVIAGDTTDLGGGPIKTLPGEESLFLARLDAQGGFLSARRIGYGPIDNVSSADENLPGIENHVLADASGNVYLAVGILGDFWFGDEPVHFSADPGSGLGTLVVKLSPDGDVLWVRTLAENLVSFVLRPDGAPLVLTSKVMPPAAPPAIPVFTRHLVGLSADGAPETPIELGGDAQDSFSALAMLDAATVLMVHRSFGPPEVFRLHLDTGARDPLDLPIPAGDVSSAAVAPGGDVVILARVDDQQRGAFIPHLYRVDSGGQLLWAKALAAQVPGAAPPVALPVRVVVDAGGSIGVIGLFQTPIDVENDALVPVASTNFNLGAILVAKYAGSGAKVWVKQMGGGGFNFANTATMLDDGDLLVGGGFSNSGVYDGSILQNPEGGGLALTLNTFLVRIPDR